VLTNRRRGQAPVTPLHRMSSHPAARAYLQNLTRTDAPTMVATLTVRARHSTDSGVHVEVTPALPRVEPPVAADVDAEKVVQPSAAQPPKRPERSPSMRRRRVASPRKL